MSILKKQSKTTTYTLSIDDLKNWVIKDLGYTPEKIDIEEVQKVTSSDPMDRYPTIYGFNGLKITVID